MPRPRPPFSPRRWLRNPHLQSVLGSTRLRLLRLRLDGGLGLLDRASELILDCGEGVRLQAFRSPPVVEGPEGNAVVVLLHGWQGCADSTYMLAVGEHLHRLGYDVLRLNLRDHGGTHHLNEGIFHANRIDEVVGAVRAITEEDSRRPLFLVGFSLGGNFALRVALRAPTASIDLRHVVAVNPALHPPSILEAIDSRALYRRYFLARWRSSLQRKQAAFPHLYDFREIMRLRDVRELTQRVIPSYTSFRTIDEYLAGYTLTGDRLATLSVPVTILTSADDPIVRIEDFHALPVIPALDLEIHSCGGHCGYIEGPTLQPWLERRIAEILGEARLSSKSR